MKPIVITIPNSPRFAEMLDWMAKNLPDTACLDCSVDDSKFFAFGTHEDWMLWQMMWSGSHHHAGDRVWVHTETTRLEATFNAAVSQPRVSVVMHPHGFGYSKGVGR